MADRDKAIAVRQAGEIANADQRWYEMEETVKKLYAPHCNAAEWDLFKTEARSLGLDPTKREFMALATGNEKGDDGNWRKTYQGYVTIHGARTLARRTGMLDSSETHWYDDQNNAYEVWLSDDPPAACKVTIYLVGSTGRGFSGVATKRDMRTFIDRKDDNREKLVPIWKERPEVMLEVRAEMRALRKAGLLSDYSILDRGFASVDPETGEILLVEGDANQRAKQSRRLHAIAASRGVTHEGAHNAVVSIDGEDVSLADAPIDDMSAAGDLIDVLDAEGVAVLTGQETETITGEPYEPVATPEPVSQWSTPDQDEWVKANKKGLLPSQFTGPEQAYLKGEAPLTQMEADALIGKMARLKAAASAAPKA